MDRGIRIAFLHPLWLLTASVASSVALLGSVFAYSPPGFVGFALPTPWPIAVAGALSFAAGLLLPLIWIHGIFRATRLALREEAPAGKWEWAFRLAIAGVVAGVVISPIALMVEPGSLRFLRGWTDVAGLVVAVAYIAVIWKTASTLVRFERGETGSDDRTVGTFLLLFYSVIGAWFLRRRLLALKAAMPREAVTAA